MKTKKIEKEFWVSDTFFSFYNKGKAINEIINEDCTLKENEGDYYKNKITISFEVQEKQVTISESEFDGFKGKWIIENRPYDYHTFLKYELFGDRE